MSLSNPKRVGSGSIRDPAASRDGGSFKAAKDYISDKEMRVLEEEEAAQAEDDVGKMCLSTLHGRNLRLLERKAQHMQYLLACLSTMGGAYHLVGNSKVHLYPPHDSPTPTPSPFFAPLLFLPLCQVAFLLAKQQEYVGRKLGSTQVVIRAQVFQAVNYGILGDAKKSKELFKLLETRAKSDEWSNMLDFVRACKRWVKHEMLALKDKSV